MILCCSLKNNAVSYIWKPWIFYNMQTYTWSNSPNSILSIVLFQNKAHYLNGGLVLAVAFSTILMIPGQSLILLSIKLKVYTFGLFDCLLGGMLANV